MKSGALGPSLQSVDSVTMSMGSSLPLFRHSLLLSPLPPRHCSPETNRMASLVNLYIYKHQKQRKRPLATPLPPNPSAGRAASSRGCWNQVAVGAVWLSWKLPWPLGFTSRPLPSAPCSSAPPPRACPGKEGRDKGRSHKAARGGQRARERESEAW